MTALVAVLAGVLGLGAGLLIDHAAARYPWGASPRRPDQAPGRAARPPRDRGRTALVAVGTAALFVLVAIRFGATAQLPAFLSLAAAGMVLTVIDLTHHLLPDRVVLPSLGIGALLLVIPAAVDGDWNALARAAGAAVVLFLVFLVLALIAPSGLGMGDVKLAALLGLYLGWLGWGAVVLGGAAGFVVQAVLALTLLATRRIGLRGELPFGPAMLLGAALAIGWTDALLGSAPLLH